MPPRTAWTGSGNKGGNSLQEHNNSNPVELPVHLTPRTQHRPRSSSLPQNQYSNHRRNQSSADNYYEDVDPRFAPEPLNTERQTQLTQHTRSSSNTVPQALMPGISKVDDRQHQPVRPTIETVDPMDNSYDSFRDSQQDGLISPAASDNSNMTSISQRGVNPNWRPQDGQRFQGPGQPNLGVPGRKPVQQQSEMVLNSNPDFELPGGRGPVIPRDHQQGQAF